MTRLERLDGRGRTARGDGRRRRTDAVESRRDRTVRAATLVVPVVALGVAAVAATADVPPGAATVAVGAAVAAVAGPGPRHDPGDGRRESVADRTGRAGGADPAVLSLLAEPYATVEEAHRRLVALERLLRERGDPRAVFLTVYASVTGAVAAAIEDGAFDDPRWVADYLVTFADLYRRAALAAETGRSSTLPTAWRLAFRAADREEALVLQHAALGINAHVSFDLAFALLAAGVDDDRRTKYRDHRRINLVLWRLVDESLDRLAERYAPGIAVLGDLAGPLVELLWFGALVAGREVAWWAAVALAESRRGPLARAAGVLVTAASTAVAGAVLAPTAPAAAVRAGRSAARTVAGGGADRPTPDLERTTTPRPSPGPRRRDHSARLDSTTRSARLDSTTRSARLDSTTRATRLDSRSRRAGSLSPVPARRRGRAELLRPPRPPRSLGPRSVRRR